MGRIQVTILLCTVLLLVSCSPTGKDCEKPFISKDGECCIDLDDNGVCDTEQNQTQEKSAQEQKEPEVVVEETKQVEVEPKQKETPEKETSEQAKQDKTEEPEETEEITEEEVQEFKESASVDASDLLDKLMKTYTEEVTGYKYRYNSDWYYKHGNKVKLKLSESEQFTGQVVNSTHYSLFVIDTVYLDLLNKTATGYCEGSDPRLGNRKCAELEITDVPLELNYGQHYTKRPDEWLFEVYTLDPEVKTETGYYYLGPRKVRRLEYTEGIKKIIMFYDEEIGLPVKVTTYINNQPSKVWIYDDLSANTVKEKHVRHRYADEISSEEVFYSTSN